MNACVVLTGMENADRSVDVDVLLLEERIRPVVLVSWCNIREVTEQLESEPQDVSCTFPS